MNALEYYADQVPWTDPGPYASLLDHLPRGVGDVCRVVQGLIYHHADTVLFPDYTPPAKRLPEVDTRSVRGMLARIARLDPRPLDEARPPERRLLGCCRDFATLARAIPQRQGVPARVRIGFGAYFDPAFNFDHVVLEYWDADRQAWRLASPFLFPLVSPRHPPIASLVRSGGATVLGTPTPSASALIRPRTSRAHGSCARSLYRMWPP